VPVRAVSTAGDRGKPRAIVRIHQYAHILSHPCRKAQLTPLVNPFNGSVH
jgi:hypothetical protein